uniref:CCR4-NOT transcription complex subunit 11 n=1 Tax=Echinococcus canadensis TaxID=519352 RepID=A0A915ETS6_9CEST
MVLAARDLSKLRNFLLDEQSKLETFSALSENFQELFLKGEFFGIGKYLVSLLNNDLLPDSVSKTLAIFLLWDMYKSEHLELNPFFPFILNFLKNEKASENLLPYPVKIFMHALMLHPDRRNDVSFAYLLDVQFQLLKTTLLQLLNMNTETTSPKTCDWSVFGSLLHKRSLKMPKVDSYGIPCVLPDEENVGHALDLQRKCCYEALLTDSELLSAFLQPLRPSFLRLAPPLLPCPQAGATTLDSLEFWAEELVWLSPPTLQHTFHWDSSMDHSIPPLEIQQLASLALSSPLSPSQKEQLVRSISQNPGLINGIGLLSENFPNLVNHNPMAASEILRALSLHPELESFLDVLSEMDVNVHSLEVINQIASHMPLPRKFILKCISNFITRCQSTQDKSSQSRLARLVCLVIQAWVRNKILDITGTNILVEIQSFCLEFNKVREANALYRLIKSIEAAGTSENYGNSIGDAPAET